MKIVQPSPELGRCRPKKAFTLVELLVAIAILALLAAIVFPVFAGVREKGWQSTCTSNERQLGAAILAYAQDYEETFPPANYVNATGSDIINWYSLVDPYTKAGIPADMTHQAGITKSILHCPDCERTALQDVDFPSRCYCANRRLMPPTGEASILPAAYVSLPATLAQQRTPAQTVLLAECAGDTAWTEGMDDPAQVAASPVANTPIGASSLSLVHARVRHSEGAVYLLGDGHARWFKAPSPNTADAAGAVPTQSRNGIVYRKCATLNPGGWFYDDSVG